MKILQALLKSVSFNVFIGGLKTFCYENNPVYD